MRPHTDIVAAVLEYATAIAVELIVEKLALIHYVMVASAAYAIQHSAFANTRGGGAGLASRLLTAKCDHLARNLEVLAGSHYAKWNLLTDRVLCAGMLEDFC